MQAWARLVSLVRCWKDELAWNLFRLPDYRLLFISFHPRSLLPLTHMQTHRTGGNQHEQGQSFKVSMGQGRMSSQWLSLIGCHSGIVLPHHS